jgi:hypothetical protein
VPELLGDVVAVAMSMVIKIILALACGLALGGAVFAAGLWVLGRFVDRTS